MAQQVRIVFPSFRNSATAIAVAVVVASVFWKVAADAKLVLYLVPSRVLDGEFWQLLTWLPAAAPDTGSVLFSALIIWNTGGSLEARWGRARFLRFLFIVTGLAGVMTLLTSLVFPAVGLFPFFGGNILSAAPALGITGQFLDDVQLDFLIKATQADRRTTTVTAPRLTLTNGQVANFYVVTQRALVTDLTPVTGDGAVGFDPTVTPVPSGVTLLIEAVITADRRYVTMNVDTSINTLDRVDQSEITAVVGGALVNSGSVGAFIQLPVQTVTRVQTTVTVPDEGTVLLGGQRLLTERQVEVGVPVLSKLPIINRFFTNRIESKEESTLVILAKPTIMIQQEAEEKAFPGIMDTVKAGMGN